MRRQILIRTLLLAGLLWPAAVAAQEQSLVRQVTDLAWAEEVDRAVALVEASRVDGQPTPEFLAAVSWVARGASFAERWDVAEQYAREAYGESLELLDARPLDAERFLPTALGAAIEVLSHTYDAQGNRAGAVLFLSEARRDYAGTSIEMRIQKNYLLLSLEGEPFPELEVDLHLGPRPPTPAELRGKVVLFFFWAHWCPDCKRQEPILRELHAEYGDEGLVVVGPTQLYGFTARGQPATPREELAYIEGPYNDQYPIPPFMSVPMGADNFVNFGVSTTPTLVLVDRRGIVQRYNPGDMTHEALVELIEPLLAEAP